MPHRALKLLVHRADPYLERARWILDHIDALSAGDENETDAAVRFVKALGNRSVTALLVRPLDWLRIANELIAASVAILEERRTPPKARAVGAPPRRGVPSAGPPRSRPTRGVPASGPPTGGIPNPRSARAR